MNRDSANSTPHSLDQYVGHCVVLDTEGSMLFIGVLTAFDERGYWLVDADVHDRAEGHATNEKYVNDAYLMDREGARPVNRRKVYVERAAVICISALRDVVADGQGDEGGAWMR